MHNTPVLLFVLVRRGMDELDFTLKAKCVWGFVRNQHQGRYIMPY